MKTLDNITNFWRQRSQQEQIILSVGGLFIAILIIYFLIVSPLQNQVSSLQQQWQANRDLLLWMKPRVATLEGQNTGSKGKAVAPSALLATLDQSAKQSSFGTTVTEVSQTTNNAVQIRFKAVPLDALLIWLAIQQEQYNVEVLQFTAQQTETIGTANAVIVLGLKK